jgi:hypothetical protein
MAGTSPAKSDSDDDGNEGNDEGSVQDDTGS